MKEWRLAVRLSCDRLFRKPTNHFFLTGFLYDRDKWYKITHCSASCLARENLSHMHIIAAVNFTHSFSGTDGY